MMIEGHAGSKFRIVFANNPDGLQFIYSDWFFAPTAQMAAEKALRQGIQNLPSAWGSAILSRIDPSSCIGERLLFDRAYYWAAWDHEDLEDREPIATGRICLSGEVRFSDIGPSAPIDAPLSPSEALTYILKTIRDRGWEMPGGATFQRDHNAITGTHESDTTHLCWRSGEMNVYHEVGSGEKNMYAWLSGAAAPRDWPTTTRANIDAALAFIFNGKLTP